MEPSALAKMLIETAVFAVLIYLVLRFLRETRGSGVIRGLALLLLVGIVCFVVLIQSMELARLALLFESIVQSVVIALIIVFHPEIRRAIVHLGDSPIFGRFFQKESKIVQRVLRAVARMSKERIGALIAVEREASLQTLVESGITIDAELNSFLIESIFYPKSALHDGAIVVRDDRIVAASCVLPLSQNAEIDKRLGTRHRAALGLSEDTDALAVVVSEETGRISVAQNGKLEVDLTLEQLERLMDATLGARQRRQRLTARRTGATLWARLRSDPVRKLAAVALGIGLWFYLDQHVRLTFVATMQLGAVPADQGVPQERGHSQLVVMLPPDRVSRGFQNLAGSAIEHVKVTFRGPKNNIDALAKDGVDLSVSLPSVAWDKVDSADFSLDHVRKEHRALAEGAVTMTMDPPLVRIQVVGISTETVHLGVDQVELTFGDDERLRSRVREDSFEFSPRFVHITGPEQAVRQLRAKTGERPLRAALAARQGDRQVSSPITLQPALEQLGLRLREPCSLTAQLRPVMETFVLGIPVLVEDIALPAELRGQYRPESALVETRVRAGGSLLARLKTFEQVQRSDWATDNLRLLVSIQPREDDSPYPVEFRALARLLVLPANEAAAEYDLEEPVSVVLRRP